MGLGVISPDPLPFIGGGQAQGEVEKPGVTLHARGWPGAGGRVSWFPGLRF